MRATTNGGAHSGKRVASVLVFDSVDGSPYLELKQTLQAPLPLTSRLETLMAFSKGFIVAGGGINGYLGVYENMVSVVPGGCRKSPLASFDLRHGRAGEGSSRGQGAPKVMPVAVCCSIR